MESTVVPVRPDGPDSKRPAAPGDLELVQAFINAIDNAEQIEEWPTPAHLGRWLVDRALLDLDIPLSASDRLRAVAMREALRELVAWGNGDRSGMNPMERIAAVADDSSRLAVLEINAAGMLVLRPVATGLDGVFARLLAIIMRAQTDGSWSRMRLCRNPGCRWVFYDASKNRSSVWCDMTMCGSRSKARAYRARQRGRDQRLANDGPASVTGDADTDHL